MTVHRIARLALSCVLVIFCGCGGGKASDDDLKAAQGIWNLSSSQGYQLFGPPDGAWTIAKLTITGGKYTTTRNNGREDSGDITLDASTDPKRCTFTGFHRDDKPRLAIYDLSGNTLRVCMFDGDHSSPDYHAQRPSKLEPAEHVIVYTFTR